MRTVFILLLTAAYPALVYWGLGHFEPRWLAVLPAGLALARAVSSPDDRFWRWAALGAALLAALTLAGNSALPLKLYPVIVNLVLLIVFGASLRHPPSAIERLARLHDPDLDAHGVAYTRRVTQVWCGFFCLNGLIALTTAFWASDRVWALYNGLISYLCIGTLMAVEYLVRRQVRANKAHAAR